MRGRARTLLVVAAAAGLVAVAVGGFGLADRFGGFVADSEVGALSTLSEATAGRLGLMLVELLFALTTSVGAALILASGSRLAGPALVLAAARLIAVLALVAGRWDRGWYYILEDGGPKLVLLLAVVQVGALAWAGLAAERAERAPAA